MLTHRKRKTYKDEAMQSAIKAVERKENGVCAAAVKFGVPRQTLTDKLKGKHSGVYGGSTALSEEDENVLVKYIKYMGSIGYPLNVQVIKAFAWSVGKRSANPQCFTECGPSDKWWRGFRKRHPSLTLRKPDKLNRRRTQTSKKSTVEGHFKLLKEWLEKEGLLNKPSHIFNVDETGIELDSDTGKVCVDRHSRKAYKEASGDREHITANICCSASGQVLPPMIIFKECFPSGHYSKDGPDEALYAKSPNGWMDRELFVEWFKKIFLRQTAHLRPAMLILDGHDSHLTLELIDLARENNVVLFCLPPHLTHLLQPLDVAVFKSLKVHFANTKNYVKIVTLGTPKKINVNRRNFTVIFREAFEKSMCMATIKNGFRRCGICPFDPDAIDWSKLRCDNDRNSTDLPSTSSNMDSSVSSTTSRDIESCIRKHPLVQNAIIPPRLVNTLILPHFEETKKVNIRCTNTGRVLTSDEHQSLVKEKMEVAKRTEAEKEERRVQRERKKAEREQKSKDKVEVVRKSKANVKIESPVLRISKRLAAVPRKDFSKVLSVNPISSDDDCEEVRYVCAMCPDEDPEGDSETVEWIGCDRCTNWYHVDCERPTSCDGRYICKKCRTK